MALNLPTTDPVLAYYRPLSMGRVVILANSDVPWSVAQARRYAKKKRIPYGNIVALALGTDPVLYTASTNANWHTAMIVPLRAKWDAVQAQIMLVAPGCPTDLQVYGVTDGATYTAGASYAVPLHSTAGMAREVDDYVIANGTTGLAVSVSAPGGFLVKLTTPPAAPFGFFGVGFVQHKLGVGAAFPSDPVYATTYEGLNAEVILLPTAAALDALGAATNRSIPSGRIGIGWGRSAFVNPSTDPLTAYRETQDTAGRVMDQGLRYSEAVSPANRYQQPWHFQLTNGRKNMTLAYLHSQLIGWGYLSSYMYRTAAHAEQEPYAPVATPLYTVADLQAGRVQNVPYHVMMGETSNNEMPDPPYKDAWQPSAGGNTMAGPSEGWLYSIVGLFRGSGSGFGNALHIVTGFYEYQYEMAHGLLRGMSWAEANYYAGQSQPLYVMICGDPLLRPFPR